MKVEAVGFDVCEIPLLATPARSRAPVFMFRGSEEKSIHLKSAGEFGNFGDTVLHAPGIEFIHDLLSSSRVPIASSSDLYRRGTSEHEFRNVLSLRDSTHADHRN